MSSTLDALASRRDVLAALGSGAAGGYVVGRRPFRDEPSPEPLAWGPTAWPMEDYDAAHTRHAPAASAPADLTEQWTAGGPFVGTVVVASGTAYTLAGRGQPTTMAARGVLDGRRQWRREYAAGPGERSLAAGGDSVFLHAATDRTAVHALAAATGDPRWTVGKDSFSPPGAPVLHGGHLYTVSPDASGVRAVDARTGRVVWRTPTTEDYSRSPAVDAERDVAVAVGLNTVAAVDAATGERRWKRTLPDARSVFAGPVVGDGRVYVSTDYNRLVALSVSDGQEEWTVEDPRGVESGFGTVAGYADGTLLVTADRGDDTGGALLGVDGASGETGWVYECPGLGNPTAPAVAGDDIFLGVDYDDVNRCRLVRVGLQGGEQRDSLRFDGHLGGAPIVAEGCVFLPKPEGLLCLG